MPYGDRTGPYGFGPMSGRGFGFCGGSGGPGYMNRPGGFGFAGRGRGWRNWFRATGLTGWQRAGWWPWAWGPGAEAREEEIAALKKQAEFFETALGNIRKRIEELETQPKTD